MKGLLKLLLGSIANTGSQPLALSQDQANALVRGAPEEQLANLGSRLLDCEAEGTLFAVVAGADVLLTVPWNCELVDATVLCTATVTSGSIQVQTAGGSAISDAIACATLGIVGRMGVAAVTPANLKIAAGAQIKLHIGIASTAGKVTLYFKRYQTLGNTNADGT